MSTLKELGRPAPVMERALKFGKKVRLTGILTEPAGGSPPNGALPVNVFLNSGIIHRVGASRIHVQMARALAREGFTSFRFDFSGIGDSEPRRDPVSFEESSVQETQEAMDFLRDVTGTEEFNLLGLCSGADVAFSVAQVDDRVIGLVKMDPYAYRTARWYLRYYGPRMLSPARWLNAIRVRLPGRRNESTQPSGEGDSSSSYVAPEYRRVVPPKRSVEEGLEVLMDRDVRLMVCFTGNDPNFAYAEQYAEAFPGVGFGHQLKVLYMPEADHTFTHPEHQFLITTRVLEWARECAPIPG